MCSFDLVGFIWLLGYSYLEIWFSVVIEDELKILELFLNLEGILYQRDVFLDNL